MPINFQRSKRSIADIFFQKLLFRKMLIFECECVAFCEVCLQDVGQIVCIFNHPLLFFFLCVLFCFFNWGWTLFHVDCSLWHFLTFGFSIYLRYNLDLWLDFCLNFCFNFTLRFLLFRWCCLDFCCLYILPNKRLEKIHSMINHVLNRRILWVS